MSEHEQQQGHSSDNITRNFDNTNIDGEPPLVTALTTPFLRYTARDPAATMRKIEARNKDIRHYKLLILSPLRLNSTKNVTRLSRESKLELWEIKRDKVC